MRTITNKVGLPVPFYNACANEDYIGGGDISITRLINPPRITTLRKFHEDEIVEDATERVWSVLGKAAHKVLELSAGNDPDIIVETRLSMPFQGILVNEDYLKWNLTGQPDVYHNGILYDYKITSVWSVIFGKDEWDKQMNLQAMLHRYKGDKVEQAFIVAILRDWQKRKAQFEKDYPPENVKRIGIPLWTQEQAVAYAKERVTLHQRAQRAYAVDHDDKVLPMCTDEERWYRGSGYAVVKMDATGKKNKRADRVFNTVGEAQKYIAENAATLPKGKVFAPVEERKGEYIRCQSYCDVWRFCAFGRALHAKMDESNGSIADVEENAF
jgi:hypothetical protein